MYHCMYCHLLVNYGALMLKALFEHWPQVNTTESADEKSSGASQVMNACAHTHTHTHAHITYWSYTAAGSQVLLST